MREKATGIKMLHGATLPLSYACLTSTAQFHDHPELLLDHKRCVVPHHILMLALAHSLDLFLKHHNNQTDFTSLYLRIHITPLGRYRHIRKVCTIVYTHVCITITVLVINQTCIICKRITHSDVFTLT